MKNIIIFLMILIFNSCITIKSNEITNRETASIMVINKINYIEKQLKRYENGKKADFSQVEDIVNLSKINPENWSGNWAGIAYIPDKEIVKKWKKWYFDNKDSFYFDPNNDCLLKLHLTNKMRNKVIFIEINDSLVRNSLYSDVLCE